MWFYPKYISQDAIEALQSVGLELKGGEMVIPENEVGDENTIVARGVKIVRRKIRFSGHQDAPKTWSSLEGDMVPSGVDRDQCPKCGYWLDRKMRISEENEHVRQCHPQYEWVLA